MLRKINSLIKQNKYIGFFKVYGIAENLNYLKYSCDFLLSDSLSEYIQFIPICGEDKFTECGMEFDVINIYCLKRFV